MITVLHGDCLDVLPTLGERFAACVTDPPYGLEFMGKEWDKFRPSGSEWSRKVAAGKDWKGNERVRPGRLYMRSSHQTCSKCGKQSHQHDDTKCTAAYELVTHAPVQMRAYQAWCEQWARVVFDALLPGAHLVCFGGSRTWHRMACAIEDAGFEIRDTLCWLYGSGFPKSLDVSKAIDKAAGVEREVIGPGNRHNSKRCAVAHGDTERLAGGVPDITAPATPEAARWQGWGTALKLAWEPIILARKPLIGTVAANVLAHGTGALNIDATRVPTDETIIATRNIALGSSSSGIYGAATVPGSYQQQPGGRWPSNVCHDGSAEVEAAFAAFGERGINWSQPTRGGNRQSAYGMGAGGNVGFGDTGTASRFFFSAKASAADRADSRHPTVKPVELMRWLVRLVTPPGGEILDPFAGSGTTGEAAMLEGFDATLIERDATHAADIAHRIKRWSGLDAPLFAGTEAYDRPLRDLFAEAAE